MLTIQIKNWEKKVVATINNIYSLQVDEEVNKWCKVKLRFPVEEWLQKKPVQKADRITIAYSFNIRSVVRIFEGYITDITLKSTEVVIEAENWLSYMQYRIIRSDKNYENVMIKDVISGLFSELNNIYELPVLLWVNDCETKITKKFEKWESFFDILKYCWEAEPKLVVRIINREWINYLEVIQDWWKVLEWVWEFDAMNVKGTNIVDWSWKDSMDEFVSTIQKESWVINNDEFIGRTKLIFEEYDRDWDKALPSWSSLPSITVSRDTDWWNFYIWDRKNIRIYTGYEWLNLEYLGLIQQRKLTVNATNDIKAEIKITQEYKADTNILDLILQNLRKKK